MADPITIHFPKYAKIPPKDKITLQPIPEPEPAVRDTSKYQYVTIPDFDMFNKPFQGVWVNDVKFERGNTYFIAGDVADEVRRLIAQSQKADIRVLQSHPDQKPVEGEHGRLMTKAEGF